MNLPILKNHDSTKMVGVVYSEGGNLKVKFTEDQEITEEKFHEIFGNVSFQLNEHSRKDGNIIIKKATILSFSL